MNTKSVIVVMLIALGIVVLASLGLTFSTSGAPISFLGLHLPAADIEFIPPAAGALALAGGIAWLIVKSKRI